jgi:hypothetical protein
MPIGWSYGLADAQIFSARAYDRLVERCMREAWPAQPLTTALGVMALVLLWRRSVGAAGAADGAVWPATGGAWRLAATARETSMPFPFPMAEP